MRRRLLQAAAAALAAAALPARAQPVAPRISAFDITMQDYVRAERAGAAALAVTRKGRLVHAAGYGDADARTPFRVASLSKPITATAVLRLVERGALPLDEPIWTRLGLGEAADARWKRVTILHLLQHTGGWAHAVGRDPMFAPGGTPEWVLAEQLRRPLDFEPGARHAYSNFGYFLLGRAIERASGMSYESFVQREVLEPIGIRGLRVAPPEGRAAELVDAHSGWAGNAVDMARFARAFDERDAHPLLSRASIDLMHARPEGSAGHGADGSPLAAYYGCGWMVRPVGGPGQAYAWHDGSLADASALMVRGYDGTNWVALFNSRTGANGRLLATGIERPLFRAAALQHAWPDGDAFGALR